MKTLLTALALLAASATAAHADIAVYNIVCANNDFIQIRADQAQQEVKSITVNDNPTTLDGLSHAVDNGQASAIYSFSTIGDKYQPYALLISGNKPMELYSLGKLVSTCTLSN